MGLGSTLAIAAIWVLVCGSATQIISTAKASYTACGSACGQPLGAYPCPNNDPFDTTGTCFIDPTLPTVPYTDCCYSTMMGARNYYCGETGPACWYRCSDGSRRIIWAWGPGNGPLTPCQAGS